MKMIKFPLLLLLSIFLLTDCKKDSKTENPDATADEITDWLKIDGAVKKFGNPPSPTVGAPVLTNLSPTTGGVTDANFSFKFSASDDFEGIYLKVKGSSSYLDIPLSSTGGKAGKGKLLGGGSEKGIAFRGGEEEDEIIVIIDLDDASNPEEFCYEYCLYDAENEVSNIVEVCVTIADWGGLDQLVGKWKNDKELNYENGVLVGTYNNFWGSLDTNSCGGIEPDYIVNNFDYIEFYSSGNYQENYKSVLNSGIPCKDYPYYNNQIFEKYNGKWSYNPAINKLILIEYNLIQNQDTPIEVSETYEGGRSFINNAIIKTINANDLFFENDFGNGYKVEFYYKRF
jgi:hypothetical protein